MLHVLTPSRGRPGNALRLREALRATCAGQWRLWLGVDLDDPAFVEYVGVANECPGEVVLIGAPRMDLVRWTNELAHDAMHAGAQWLASLGDDHVPRTYGWDKALIAAIEAMPGPGWAYGDDLLRGQDIPTAWVQSAHLVRALGWMMLPACEHLGVDLAVRDLGRAAGRIAYDPAVVVEHLHFVNGKAPDDQTYAHGNSATRIRDDNAAHGAWLRSAQFSADVTTVQSLTWEAHRGQSRH